MPPAKKTTKKAATKKTTAKKTPAKRAVKKETTKQSAVRSTWSARGQRGREAQAAKPTGDNRRFMKAAEMDAYIRRVMKQHPTSSRVDERKYAAFVEGIAFSKARWDAQWEYVENGGRPLKDDDPIPGRKATRAAAPVGFRKRTAKKTTKKTTKKARR